MNLRSVHLRKNGAFDLEEGSVYQECMKIHRRHPFSMDFKDLINEFVKSVYPVDPRSNPKVDITHDTSTRWSLIFASSKMLSTWHTSSLTLSLMLWSLSRLFLSLSSFRTIALTSWPLFNAWATKWSPLFPDAPKMAIFAMLLECPVLQTMS